MRRRAWHAVIQAASVAACHRAWEWNTIYIFKGHFPVKSVWIPAEHAVIRAASVAGCPRAWEWNSIYIFKSHSLSDLCESTLGTLESVAGCQRAWKWNSIYIFNKVIHCQICVNPRWARWRAWLAVRERGNEIRSIYLKVINCQICVNPRWARCNPSGERGWLGKSVGMQFEIYIYIYIL